MYKPNTPNLTKKPLKNIENSVEASTWAFNNQEVKGHSGTLTPKPKIKKKMHKVSTENKCNVLKLFNIRYNSSI